jgi:TonB family protein
VRLVPLEPEPKSRTPRLARKGAEDRPVAASKSVHAPRVPATPVEQPSASGRPSVREHFPSYNVFDAYSEFPDAVQEELLSEAQRRIPRGNTLAQTPQPIVPILPRYPGQQLKQGVKGQILVEGFISAGGAVDDVVVIHDEGKPELAAAVVQALRGTPFRPGAGPGGATRSRITLRFVFNFE